MKKKELKQRIKQLEGIIRLKEEEVEKIKKNMLSNNGKLSVLDIIEMKASVLQAILKPEINIVDWYNRMEMPINISANYDPDQRFVESNIGRIVITYMKPEKPNDN